MNTYHTKTKAIIFDFDGVIVDSIHTTIKKWKVLLKHFNKDNPIDETILRNNWQGNWKDFYRNHLRFSDTEVEKSIDIFRSLRGEEYLPPLVKNMKEVLVKLANDFMLVIVSSGYTENISPVLEINDITGLFSKVYGSNNLSGFAKPQPEVFQIPLKELRLMREETYTVGDSADDIRTARLAGLPAIACTWGWNSREVLETESPEFIADKPEDLYNFFTKLPVKV